MLRLSVGHAWRWAVLEDPDEGDWVDELEREEQAPAAPPWHRRFRESRWFTRGWTLQELLAPIKVHFFDQDWNLIGWKRNLVRTIREITGIDELALEDSASLVDFAIARKMSWAADRRTSRIEDRAYSLLGIFGVNMPLLYGEGNRAFVRLQEELVRTSMDQSVLVWNWKVDRNSSTTRANWGERKDMVFAMSPDAFWIGKTVVPWKSSLLSPAYRLTNKGLQFDSIPFIKSDSEYFALLNCRFEDDLRGPLALRLWGGDRRSELKHLSDVSEENDFWIMQPRFVVCAVFETAEILSRQATVLRFHFTTYRTSNRDRTLPKVWVKSEQSLPEMEIIDAFPNRLWNTTTGVMIPSRKYARSYSFKGSFVARLRFPCGTAESCAEQLLSVAFDVSEGHKDFPRIVIAHGEDHKELLEGLRSRLYAGPILAAEAGVVEGWRFHASIQRANILGDIVYVITVTEGPEHRT